MRFFVISNETDTLTGMRLAGMEGAMVSDRRSLEEHIEKVCADENIAVLLITENCASFAPDIINKLKLSGERPLVTVIPGSHGSQLPPDSITRLIREAIGVNIDA